MLLKMGLPSGFGKKRIVKASSVAVASAAPVGSAPLSGAPRGPSPIATVKDSLKDTVTNTVNDTLGDTLGDAEKGDSVEASEEEEDNAVDDLPLSHQVSLRGQHSKVILHH